MHLPKPRLNISNFNFNGSFFLDDAVSMQKNSYLSFLSSSHSGISQSLKDIFPVYDSLKTFYLEYISHSLKTPLFNHQESKKRGLTYSAELSVRLRLTCFKKDDVNGEKRITSIKEQDVTLCSMPLMTDFGTFIINGVERVVVSQIHRSPGVFFTSNINESSSSTYLASIIPYRGTWVDFLIDQSNTILVNIDKKKKIPFFAFCRGLGIEYDSIISSCYEELSLSRHTENLLSISLNIKDLTGERLKISLFDQNGNLVFPAGKIILTRDIKNIQTDKFFISIDELANFAYSYSNCGSFLAGQKLNAQDLVDAVDENKIFSIINFFVKTYSPVVINSIHKFYNSSEKECCEILYSTIRPNDSLDSYEDLRSFVHSIFFDPSKYDMSKVGRYKINTSLGLQIDDNFTTLTKEDFISIVKYLCHLKENNLQTDDIDHLGNRRIRVVGELLENQFRVGLSKAAKSCVDRMIGIVSENISPSDIFISGNINKLIKDFFATSQLSQFMEQTNPLSEIGHKRRISALGVGGIDRDRAGLEVRDVHSTHYGRICIVETPEGQNIGLISNLATFARINKYGFIETPYRVVKDSKVTNEIVYLDANNELHEVICQYSQKYIESSEITDNFVDARKNGEIIKTSKSDITLIDVAPNQIVSAIASLVPFLENDDAYRVLMGANMQRQAVPLIKNEPPLVGTGMESYLGYQSSGVIKSSSNGKVAYVDASRIAIQKDNLDVEIYNLTKFSRTNGSTCINYNPVVKLDDIVQEKHIIAEGYSTSNGEISVGKNVLIAFMSWNGLGFEDSIAVSERLVNNESFTSVHIEEFEVTIRDTRLGPEEVTRDIPGIPEQILSKLDESGIIQIGSTVKAGDILVGKVTPKTDSPVTPEEKLLRAIFDEKISEVKDSSLRLPPGYSGVVTDVSILTKRGFEKCHRANEIELTKVNNRKADKNIQTNCILHVYAGKIVNLLSGIQVIRCEKNKHITSSSFSLNDIMRFSFDMFDILTDDKKINFEISEFKKQFNASLERINSEYDKDVASILDGSELPNGTLMVIKVYVAMKSRLQPGDKMAGRHGNKGIISKVIPVQDMPFTEDGTPIDMIMNPLGTAARMNLGQILEVHLGLACKMLGKKIEKDVKEASNLIDIRNSLKKAFKYDKEILNKIDTIDDNDIKSFASSYFDGVPVANPAFQSCKVDTISDMLEDAGCDRSGQMYLYDGLTGKRFERKITVGYMYVMKLHHLVDNKVHARSVGPYSLVTQQPLGGKSHFGGQRVGEMESWAFQAYGAAHTLQEMLTVKSDDVDGRRSMYNAIVQGRVHFSTTTPESMNVMLRELSALGLNVSLNSDS